MTATEKHEILDIIGDYLAHPRVQEMKDYVQHGSVSTYKHVVNVTKIAYRLDKRFHLGNDKEVLLTAALLHDFYLYDWHDKPYSDLHGFRHPKRAADNALEMFGVDDRVRSAIESHMWPFTLLTIPKSTEAWTVCMADKIATMIETLWMR